MNLYRILFKSSKRKLLSFTLLSIAAGVVNALLFAYINQLLSLLVGDKRIELKWHIFSFLFIVWIFIFSRRYLSLSIIEFTQAKLKAIKGDLVSLVTKAKFTVVTRQKETITNVLTTDVQTIADAGSTITTLVSYIILTIGSVIYIATLSWKLFFITMLIIAFGYVSYSLKIKKITKAYARIRELNDQFIGYLHEIISGFKEVKVDHKKGEDIETNYVKENLAGYHATVVPSASEFVNAQYVGIVLFYITIGFILLGGEYFLNLKKEELLSFVFILLYINGPIEGIVLLLPTISDANVSAKRLIELSDQLREGYDDHTGNSGLAEQTFNSLELNALCYTHKTDENQFEVGPLSLLIQKQDLIFIHGQNGSGKTSLILCLLGIYKYDSGDISLNGVKTTENISSLFSTVFSDFFLFDRFYGNNQFDRKKAEEYLTLFELGSKVKILEHGFSTLKLSMGQRKRLALIQALLEEKPVLILDEWAADQDPFFRKKFYLEILPELKRYGKTIIAITHDDTYFASADKLIKMDFGRIVEVREKHKV
jgi:putative ATP-binding cassette transporter